MRRAHHAAHMHDAKGNRSRVGVGVCHARPDLCRAAAAAGAEPASSARLRRASAWGAQLRFRRRIRPRACILPLRFWCFGLPYTLFSLMLPNALSYSLLLLDFPLHVPTLGENSLGTVLGEGLGFGGMRSWPQLHGQACMDQRVYRLMDGWCTYGWMGRWMDRWM